MGVWVSSPPISMKPYPWYVPFIVRLQNAMKMDGHRSEAYTGNPKKKKSAWPKWRQQVARSYAVLDVFLSQPECWLVGNFPLTYPQCRSLRRLFYWQTKCYLHVLGFTEK